VHRIGRTARAGAAGIAIAFCDPAENGFLRDIERLTRASLTVVQGEPGADRAPAVRDYARKAPFRGKRGNRDRCGARHAA